LNCDNIGPLTHQTAQRVNLANEVSFGNATNRRIAGHLRNQIQIHGNHGGS
jgi:hypothetical protein